MFSFSVNEGILENKEEQTRHVIHTDLIGPVITSSASCWQIIAAAVVHLLHHVATV